MYAASTARGWCWASKGGSNRKCAKQAPPSCMQNNITLRRSALHLAAPFAPPDHLCRLTGRPSARQTQHARCEFPAPPCPVCRAGMHAAQSVNSTHAANHATHIAQLLSAVDSKALLQRCCWLLQQHQGNQQRTKLCFTCMCRGTSLWRLERAAGSSAPFC